jgi:lipopolysaccharide export system permease protein
MRILTRYIVFDLLKVFLLTLFSMTVFMFFALAAKQAVSMGLGLVPILRMAPYLLPQAMQFAVPGSMLLAATTVYGRVAASNEIVAIKSLGISPMVMIWPALTLATVVSLSAVVLNDVAVSWGRAGAERVILESLEEIVYGRLRTVRSFSNDRLKVTVHHVEGKRLMRPTIFFYASHNKPAWTITAAEAAIETNPETNTVTLELVNADVDFGGKASMWDPDLQHYEFSLADFTGQQDSARSPSNYALREIGPARAEQLELEGRLTEEMTAEAGYALMTGRSYELAEPIWQDRTHEIAGVVNTLHRLDTEPHRRWATGFSCLGFVLIGAPMAIRRRHGEVWGNFFACFLLILLVYYPLLMAGVDFAKQGIVPPQTVWLGNLVLAVWGVWLVRRVVRF